MWWIYCVATVAQETISLIEPHDVKCSNLLRSKNGDKYVLVLHDGICYLIIIHCHHIIPPFNCFFK